MPQSLSIAESRLSPQRKLALHPQFVDRVQGKRIYPINVEISPCGICQASCPFCFYANTGELGNHRNVMLQWGTLLGALAESKSLGVKSVSWTGGGEPSLYPKIQEAIECAAEMGLQQGMFTNALTTPKYHPGYLEWIRVTMTDKPFRPDYIKMLRGTKTLSIAFNYSGAEDDVYLRETLRMAEECRVDYLQVRPALKFHGQTVDIKPPQMTHPLLHVTSYKFEDAKHEHGYATCEGYHFVPFIWEDGNVDVCAYMRKNSSGAYTLGNLYSKSLKEILDSSPEFVGGH